MITDQFFQIGLVIIIATVIGLIASRLRQPLIPAYILAGILVGPVFGLVQDATVVQMLSLWGVAFFLFMIGLEMDLRTVSRVGMIATAGGTLQVILTFTLSYVVLHLIVSSRAAIYLAIAVALSSTMIVVQMLSDRREIDTLHGRIIVGILLMQDILAILALSALSTFNGNAAIPLSAILAAVGALLVLTLFASRFIFPALFRFAAHSQQLLFLLSISTCLLFSLAFHYLNLSIAIGAFLGGLALASLPYTTEIVGRIKPLRDFFSTLFFVSLGLSLSLSSFSGLVPVIVAILLLTVVLKPLLVMAICSFFGHVKRTAFLTGITLGQISEFSLIIAAVGLSLGHLSPGLYAAIIIVAMITIGLTSYAVQFEQKLYKILRPLLKFLEWNSADKPLQYLPNSDIQVEAVLVGYDRIGYSIFKSLQKLKKKTLIVDFNPDIIRTLIERRVPCLYGDIFDPELLERINLRKVNLFISTAVTLTDNRQLIRQIKSVNSHCTVFVAANTIADA